MSRFVVYKDPRKKKWQLVFAWAMLLFGLFNLVLLAVTHREADFVISVFLPVYLVWSGMERLLKLRREYFIEITDDHVGWKLSDINPMMTVAWNDVRWLKRESKNLISLFRESSFREPIDTTLFSEAEREKIATELSDIATARGLRLINFSTDGMMPA
ncbi:MAG: hypothetical protein JO301_17160 [Chitinophagaceae bacterium]|nr:hypothetical protein [Chitinophagaceae bacterium]